MSGKTIGTHLARCRSGLVLTCMWLTVGLGACNPTDGVFGPLPQLTRKALPAAVAEEQRTWTGTEQEQLYRVLRPHFGALRHRPVPFRCDDPRYRVEGVTLERLRSNCDLELDVRLSSLKIAHQDTVESTSTTSIRLYVLCVDHAGRPFDRTLAEVPLATSATTEGSGKLILHLPTHPGGYEEFDHLHFVPVERFREAAEEIRAYNTDPGR